MGTIIVIILLIFIYILNLIDYFETIYCIKAIGDKIEANPLARFLFKHHLAWMPKFIGFPILLAIMGYIVIAIDIFSIWAPCLLLALYLHVVVHNFKAIKKIRAYKNKIKEKEKIHG